MQLARLTDFSIGYRYPGMDADSEMANEAFLDASYVREILRRLFAQL